MQNKLKKKSQLPQTILSGPSIQTAGDNKSIIYLPISEQIRRSMQKTSRMPMITGCILGAFVPIAVYLTAHSEAMQNHGNILRTIQAEPFLALLITGGLLFSATSVFRWGYQAFGHSWVKALGFVVLVEGTLILSPIPWLALVALAYLVIINGLATGTTLALDRKKHFALQNKGGRPPKTAQPAGTQPTQTTPAPSTNTGPTKKQRKKTGLEQTKSPVPEPEFPKLLPEKQAHLPLSEMLKAQEK